MGQKQTKSVRQELKFNQQDWLQLRADYNKTIMVQYQLVTCTPQQHLEHELQIYYYRKMQDHALVTIYAAEPIADSQAPLCSSSQGIRVIYQRIPCRLADIAQLSFPESLYVLSECYRGFKECYEKVGSFDVNENMIGFNLDNQVKVWLNQNYAFNHPEIQKPTLQITSTNKFHESAFSEERDMLYEVTRVVENKTEQGQFPQDFRDRIYSCQTFVDGYCSIQNFCEQKRVWIPDRLPSSTMTNSSRRMLSGVSDSRNDKNIKIESSASQSPHAVYVPNVQYSQPRVTYVGEGNVGVGNGVNGRKQYVIPGVMQNIVEGMMREGRNGNMAVQSVPNTSPFAMYTPDGKTKVGSPRGYPNQGVNRFSEGGFANFLGLK